MNTKRAALAGGLTWGGLMFITTLAGIYFQYGTAFLNLMASIYPGYSITVIGSLIGFIYGYLGVYIGIYLISWIYAKVR